MQLRGYSWEKLLSRKLDKHSHCPETYSATQLQRPVTKLSRALRALINDGFVVSRNSFSTSFLGLFLPISAAFSVFWTAPSPRNTAKATQGRFRHMISDWWWKTWHDMPHEVKIYAISLRDIRDVRVLWWKIKFLVSFCLFWLNILDLIELRSRKQSWDFLLFLFFSYSLILFDEKAQLLGHGFFLVEYLILA